MSSSREKEYFFWLTEGSKGSDPKERYLPSGFFQIAERNGKENYRYCKMNDEEGQSVAVSVAAVCGRVMR